MVESKGVDVSNHQRGIQWATMAAAGISFSYAKASEGVGYVDPMVDSHLDGARGSGMYAGLYHYARPDTNAPESDAGHFAAQLMARNAAAPGSLPPCLDMEEAAPVDMVSWTKRCIERLRDITGYGPVMIYANTSWWNAQLAGGSWLDDQTFSWVAHYGRTPGSPGYRSDHTVMHQYTSSGRVAGYNGDLDLNSCWVDLATLAQGQGATPPVRTAPDWPLPPEHYFGLITGPAQSHGGWYASEQGWVRSIQEALQRKGYAPDRAGWADGKYEQPTRQAVLAWQRAVGYHETGNIWPDDWELLLG